MRCSLTYVSPAKKKHTHTPHAGILLDTKGPEIRTGFFADDAKKITLKKGDNITLTADYNFKGSSKKLACSYASLATSVKTGQSVLVADGSLVLTVLSCHPSEGEVVCRIENDCSIGERKNMVSSRFSSLINFYMSSLRRVNKCRFSFVRWDGAFVSDRTFPASWSIFPPSRRRTSTTSSTGG